MISDKICPAVRPETRPEYQCSQCVKTDLSGQTKQLQELKLSWYLGTVFSTLIGRESTKFCSHWSRWFIVLLCLELVLYGT